jgi:mutator protein MutT
MIRHKTAAAPTAFCAAGCFCLHEGRVLIIKRQAGKPYGLHWGIPTGKTEPGETPRQAMVRELAEEVGLAVAPEQLTELVTYVVEDGETVFEYVAFALELAAEPTLTLRRQEVARADWTPLPMVRKRRVVPYFYNTFNDLLEWRERGRVQRRMLAEPEARSARAAP